MNTITKSARSACDSVGHYDGDMLVIDTIGIKIGPFSLIDWNGTPYTQALHVVERYRLIDHEVAKEAEARTAKEYIRVPFRGSGATSLAADPYKGKALQLQFTIRCDCGAWMMKAPSRCRGLRS
jgi:hypothetical protein